MDVLIQHIDRLLEETILITSSVERNKKINEILELPDHEVTVEMLFELRTRLQWALNKSLLIAQSGDSASLNPVRKDIDKIHSEANQILSKLYE